VPVPVATYLINEKREWLRTLEDKSTAELIIVPNESIQTPEYSIKRVRDDEIDLPENKQATYLMPTAPEVAEPGSAQDTKPQPEAPAVATLLPTTPAPMAAAPAIPAAREPAATAGGQPAHEGFWTRFKRFMAGEPAAPAEQRPAVDAAPAAGRAHRDEGQRRDGRREHSRHGRYGESARRDRGDERRGERRDRDRGRGREGHEGRGREPGRGGRDRVAERSAERNTPSREPAPSEENRLAAERSPAAPTPPSAGELRGEHGERRGRRGRRRGRRGGGGGAREGLGQASAAPSMGAEIATPTNGSHQQEAPATVAAPPPPAAEQVRESPDSQPPRAFHAEPRESSAGHDAAPLAHFEPSPKPEVGAPQSKPYVVWSSAPPKDAGPRGPEE